MDYGIFYKDQFASPHDLAGSQEWDVFVSAFNTTERVRDVFDAVVAKQKHWIVHNEYGFSPAECPGTGQVYAPTNRLREDQFIRGFLDALPSLRGLTLAIDISGFMRPHLAFLLRILHFRGVKSLDALYSEPGQYSHHEATQFASGDVSDVRPVAGFEGTHSPSVAQDKNLLVIAAGYEHELLRQVANAKIETRKLQVLGFPPLQADFYQHNRLNARKAAEAVSAVNERRPIFSPANDPFVTAAVLHDTVETERQDGIENVYLCPLASRPQTLGFALYYLYEAQDRAVSLIYPFTPRYAREAATGIARIWRYRIELP